MGVIRTAFEYIFRDFTADGVAASGLRAPEKREIRSIGATIEAALANITLGAMLGTVKQTKALLDGDLAHDAAAIAIVWGDGTDANNDLYVKLGASGAGSWQNTGALHQMLSGIAFPYTQAAAASAVQAAAQVVLASVEVAKAAARATEAGAYRDAAARQAAAEMARDQIADMVGTENIFVDVSLAAAEGGVSVGDYFKLIATGPGTAEVRKRTVGGSDLLYSEATTGALAADTGTALVMGKQSFAGAFARSIADIFEDEFSVMSAMSLAERIKVRLGTSTADLDFAFNAAINACAARGGGNVRVPAGHYHAQAIAPKGNVTLAGEMATIQLPAGATSAMIYYNNAATLRNFNLSNLILDGDGEDQDLIHINEPAPVAPDKTWQYSTVFNVQGLNCGGFGLYCPIPGRVRLFSSWFYGCDIAVAWDREHLDIYGTQIEGNRIGVRSTGNHFVAMHSSIAHNTEAGWSTIGAGLGLYNDVYEAGFVGVTFLDNPVNFQGKIYLSRLVSVRFSGASGLDEIHIDGSIHTCVITTSIFNIWKTAAIRGIRQFNTISTNLFIAGEGKAPAILTPEATYRTEATLMNKISTNEFVGSAICMDFSNPTYGLSYNSIKDNVGWQIGCLVRAQDVRSHNRFDDNEAYQLFKGATADLGPGRMFDLTMWTGSQIESLSVSGNFAQSVPLEAIKITATTTFFSAWIDNNRIIDANTSNTADTDAIALVGTAWTAASLCMNKARNTGAGKARYAVRVTGAAADCLLGLNLARGMLGANSYKVPAAGVTAGTNVGTVDAS